MAEDETGHNSGHYSLLSSASLTSLAGSSLMIDRDETPNNNKLSTFFGVIVPCTLSIFSVILFLRLGYIVGQAGFLVSVGMFTLAYFVVVLTTLSISAISTNGTVKGGGAYFMISRALGPEFGGSIGVIFYFANVFASALYVIGFAEAVIAELNSVTKDHYNGFWLNDPWAKFIYGSAVLFFCLVVCLIGAGLFAKTSFVIFLLVIMSVMCSLVSFLLHYDKEIPFPDDNPLKTRFREHHNSSYLHYTGWNLKTFEQNLYTGYKIDYSHYKADDPSTHVNESFASVFGVLFNGVTGIMAGANMSGDLKNPSYSIPLGTLLACAITYIIYIVLVFFTSFTCSRELLWNDYSYLKDINPAPAIITIGVFAATLSAALGTLIGASRILQALAKDDLLGSFMRPFGKGFGRNGNPIYAVLISWLLVQCILFSGELNIIAQVVSMFFLLSYGVTNLACFGLRISSAPNFSICARIVKLHTSMIYMVPKGPPHSALLVYTTSTVILVHVGRPAFQYYSWKTALLGTVSCITIMFFVNHIYAGVAVAVMIVLSLYISLRAPATPWGDISQAIIYHQVRKYLLRLDVRKKHVKFWRPQILILVSNPRSSYQMIDFGNDIKKSGLYILGNVMIGHFNPFTTEKQKHELRSWLNFIRTTEIKAFFEQNIAPSVRAGAQHLLMASGLGGMKPNTVIMGFYDTEIPKDVLNNSTAVVSRSFWKKKKKNLLLMQAIDDLPPLRDSVDDQKMTLQDYVGILEDAVMMGKNICIARHFQNLDKNNIPKDGFIDVWPMNVCPAAHGLVIGPFDYTFLLVLQLSCILHMVPFWEDHTRLRVMSIVHRNEHIEKSNLTRLLKELRISAEVKMIYSGEFSHMMACSNGEPDNIRSADWYSMLNRLIRCHSEDAVVVMTSLPRPPGDASLYPNFIQDIRMLSENLPPMLMIYGTSSVISTSL